MLGSKKAQSVLKVEWPLKCETKYTVAIARHSRAERYLTCVTVKLYALVYAGRVRYISGVCQYKAWAYRRRWPVEGGGLYKAVRI